MESRTHYVLKSDREPNRMANSVSPSLSFQVDFGRSEDGCDLSLGELMLEWEVSPDTADKSLGTPSPSLVVLSLLSMYLLSEGRKSKSP